MSSHSTNPRRAVTNAILSRQPVESEHSAKQRSEGTSASMHDWWSENWAVNVFTHAEMKKRVPKSVYKEFQTCVRESRQLPPIVADVIANAMKDWAVERGATHFTHWFQPIHIATARKDDSFISFTGNEGKTILEFSGGELIRGEPDASSFPNGGIRSTYEARGYTTWDPNSPAFLVKNTNGLTLLIPTCFCSWTGEALDVKTPLLRSSESLSREAVRLLKIIGDHKVRSVHTTLGAEQEFFVIDRGFFLARPDLLFSGRSVIGAKPPKGQEMEDHYFATMPPRVMAYIQEVEQELWLMGIPTKTRHNEVAPGQHEMAPIFEDSNLAADHNMIMMEVLRDVATRHNLTCLLHEKPFAYVNGSGKHNNWSMATDYGVNLLEPSKSPRDNMPFHVFLAAVIRAVDAHADILRASIATPGNDFRLGANEAPPAIMSIYLGSEIDELVRELIAYDDKSEPSAAGGRGADGRPSLSKMVSELNIGGTVAPFKRDRTDRNRTSPFAFTGNKFEFRAVGSSQNVGATVTILNTIVADAIRSIATEIEKTAAEGIELPKAIRRVVRDNLRKHERIIFNGNGYSQEWVVEAEKRGLPNLRETVAALSQFESEKSIRLFESLRVFSASEIKSRKNVYFEHYCNTINIEAQCALNLINAHVIPSGVNYQTQLATSIKSVKELNPAAKLEEQTRRLGDVTLHVEGALLASKNLSEKLAERHKHHESPEQHAIFFRDVIKPCITEARVHSDKLEHLVPDEVWTLPKYSDMLFLK
ncbi:glutamine synthetase catalytic region [Capsaspora owczarzaki ATCC 30864]|uniref:glutamine synthetase catalytic region n=1 Tax=Capsaspora owczarzaki (strain ATCC 30864) TaxID=595528 RepID=UPI0003522D80|nr:glutamine synthetase catalytic region [Capsaspora owczarzaki ATCC 30864]|eukprot:XP_004347075.2 glutamine synthetase catalytic region [Capsaspora owczarzaki ATCC 30864]